MKSSLQKILKIFKLEAERGYDNHAVMGGLDRLLDHWLPEARVDGIPEDLIQIIENRLRDYPRLSPTSRAEALEGLIKRIQRGGAPPPMETIPSEPPDEQQIERIDLLLESTLDEQVQVEVSETAPIPAPVPEVRPAAAAWKGEPAALDAQVTVLPGIGPRHAQTLARLGIHTLRDMLYYFPRRYDDYSRLKPINRLQYGDEVTVIGTVQSVGVRSLRNGHTQMVEAVVSDGTAALRVTWFNQAWVSKRLQSGHPISLSGKVDQYLGRLVMNNPEWEPIEQQQLSTNRIVPVYALTAQITQRWLRKTMNEVIMYWAPRVQDPLPPEVARSARLIDLPSAIIQMHFPDSWEELENARQRLAFDEIFLLQIGVLQQKRAWEEQTARVFETEDAWLEEQVAGLPFPLTGAQQKAVADLRGDLVSGRPMNRLLQGDVGSGKTVVAALAIGMVVRHGAQAALMVPTSILAEQHYKNLLGTMTGKPAPSEDGVGALPPMLQDWEIRLMIGATPEAEKNDIRRGLAEGWIKLVIGTHALIEEPVQFANLQLTIIDEQHRFGVEQRAALRAKGENPHLLVMTATPIPRSLALTVYGDLDLTVMDEMPEGRQPVSTHVLAPRERERAYALIRSQVKLGRQAFIIYPLVQESEKTEAMAAVEEHARLQSAIFPDLQLGLLHGRLSLDEKDDVMRRFRDRDVHVLVATSVVEVGLDVPNATVMLIEGANRFGLSQLHQFRGRVGRGGDQAYCLLVPDAPDAVENERLQVMAETNDGFVLAERDLEQRGPGQFLGTSQSGFAELQFASLTDVRLIEKARHQAQALFDQDPNLAGPQYQPLTIALRRFWGDGRGDIS